MGKVSMEWFNLLAGLIGGVGIVVITWGALIAFLELLRLEVSRFKGIDICDQRELLRHHLGSYLLLGLEFMIAADIIYTIVHRTIEGLITLSFIVAIRTAISYFLNKELKSAHPQNNESSPQPLS